MDQEVVALIQRLYHTRDMAWAVLTRVEYPVDKIPEFDTAETFWPKVLFDLDDRVVDGTLLLLKQARVEFPGRGAAIGLLLDRLTEARPEPERAVRPGPWGVEVAAADVPPPAPPGSAAVTEPPPAATGCPTLTLQGADLPEEFLVTVRRLLGRDTELLYVAPHQSAVRIPDPGELEEAVRQTVQEAMRAHEPACLVTYVRYPFRPYLYARLEVRGPDNSPYELRSVPATATAEDIAAAILMETRVGVGAGVIRVIVDHESDERSRRLDLSVTLHECGIGDGDRLRVAPDATAGGIAPELRMEAQLRAADQIRGYTRQDRRLMIVGYDDEDLPGRITVEIAQRGLAPPVDDVVPDMVETHRISVHFPAMFPLAAPEIVWESPIFHPNVHHAALGGVRPGTLRFHPLLYGYRPEFDMVRICRVMADIAAYRDYDLADGPDSPNPAAALWAGTTTGQIMIKAIGGRLLADVVRERDGDARPPRLFWIRPLGEGARGH